MPNLVNLFGEINADIVGNDAQPALRLRNTSTGPGLHSEGLAVTSNASVDRLIVTPAILAANATIPGLDLGNPSRASGAFIRFVGGLVSVTSILATTGGVAGTYAARVVLPIGTFGWIPVYPDAAVTAAAV